MAYLWCVEPRSLRTLVARVIDGRGATALAFLVVAVLGFALNDSGITIPGMMAAVFESTVVIVLALVFGDREHRTWPRLQPSSRTNRDRHP